MQTSAASGHYIGHKRAKRDFKIDKMNEASIQNGTDIGEEIKNCVRLLEEKNALQEVSINECI